MIKLLTNRWDNDNKNRIDDNFRYLSKIPSEIIHDLLSLDPSKIDTRLNGLSKSSNDLRNLDDYGINFRADVNGVLFRTQVYASRSGKLGIGLHEQKTNDVAGALIKYIVVDVKSGWNSVILNFPVEVGQSYTLFKRNESETILTSSEIISGWATYPWISNGLTFNAGKYLDQAGTYRNYSTFFEIELVTNPATVFYMMYESAKPDPQFHVGSTPPTEGQFWFRPVGD